MVILVCCLSASSECVLIGRELYTRLRQGGGSSIARFDLVPWFVSHFIPAVLSSNSNSTGLHCPMDAIFSFRSKSNLV